MNQVRKSVRRPLGRAANSVVEMLEGRTMLTSVAAGQIGVFQGPDGQPVRVNISGSGGALDFIGATRDELGNAQLNDIPMTIFDQAGNVVRENLGGYAGRGGIKLADFVLNNDVGDSVFRGPDAPYNTAPNGRVNLDGLAANNLGRTYGVNRFLSGPGNAEIDILNVDSKMGAVTLNADVTQDVLTQLQLVNPNFTSGDLLSVIGADFPNDNANLMYFALQVNYPTQTGGGGGGGTPTFTRTPTPAMFTYNLQTHEVTLDPTLFGFNDPQNDKIRIDDFTFMTDGRIAMFGSVQLGAAGQAQVGLFFSDADAVIPDGFTPVRIGEQIPGQPLPAPTTSLAAIEAIPGETYMIAVTNADPAGGADDAQLVRVDLGTGFGHVIGPVVNPDQSTTIVSRLGENIRDLTWNSRVYDHYYQPGKRGVLLGEDSTYDVLVALDARDRFPTTDLYAIYGNNVQSDTSASIADFTLDPNTNLSFNTRLFRGQMNPLSGSAGVLRTLMTNGDPVNLPLANGGLYIGIRERDVDDTLSIPVLSLNSKTDLAGSSPGASLPRIVRPGVYINGSMSDLLIGGTITGSVNINGSINTLYAGNVLTGDPYQGVDNTTDNFFVNGDLRNLIVSGGIGTLPGVVDRYQPNTDFAIGGRVQQIKAGAIGFRGSVDVVGRTSEQTIGSALTELESRPDNRIVNRIGLAFEGRINSGILGYSDTAPYQIVDSVTQNDTFATAEVLGSYYSKTRKRGGQVTVNGNLNNGPNFNDDQDFYGVPLLAGQTMAVNLTGTGAGLLQTTLAIMDPDGRTIATDLSNQNKLDFQNQTLTITADKPGIWRLVVNPIQPTTFVDRDRPYTLTVDKIGEMAIGGLVSAGDLWLNRSDLGLRARSGDIGAVLAAGITEATSTLIDSGRDQTFGNPILASTGNIRSVEGASIGRLLTGIYSHFPNISAPRGTLGLVRAPQFVGFNVQSLSGFTGEPVPAATMGHDIQVIESAGDVTGVFSANDNIGVIRAASFSALIPPASPETGQLPGYIRVNSDGRGTGELGLINVTGDFGTIDDGGPTLSEGDGGNIRYLSVGGTVYRPLNAGGGGLETLTGRDKAVKILDDSGATITLTPYNGVNVSSTVIPGGSNGGTTIPDPFGGNGNTTSTGGNGIPDPFGGSNNTGQGNVPIDPFNGANGTTTTVPTVPQNDIVGTLRVSGYPVVGGGYVVYNVVCTTGIAVSTGKKGGGGSGDIGQLTTSAALGTPIVNPTSEFDQQTVIPSQQQTLSLGTGTTLDIIMSGGTVNVYQIGTTAGAALDFSRILNNTDGEIVNIHAGDVGYLSAQTIGVSRPVGGVRVEGLTNASDPRFTNTQTSALFSGIRNGIFLDNAIDIRSRGAIGNIFVTDTVQNIQANSDGVNDRGVFEGIVGPIIQTNADRLIGGIRSVDIGEGLATSGSGDYVTGGLYITGVLGLVTNKNGNGDVRGDIVTGRYFEGLRLGGGASILDSDIIQQGIDFVDGTPFSVLGNESNGISSIVITPPTDLSQLAGIGAIRLSGNGGILNTRIDGYNIGRITTDDAGFGVLNSSILSSSGGTMTGISAGGLGLRNTLFEGGSFVGDVVATGKGSLVDVRNLSLAARPRSSGYFDPATGIAPNAANDLNLLLGTSAKLPKIEGVTNSGIIQDTRITALRSVKSVRAFEIRGVNTGGTRPRDETYPMAINFANSIGTISAGRNINGARITGGTIGTISAGRDMVQLEVENNAAVKTISAGRNILGSVDIHMTGNGSLQTLSVGRNMNGTMFIPKGIRSIIVGGNIGSAYAQGGIRSGTDINLLRVAGDVNGNAYIRATRTIKMIDIDGDVTANATIRATSFGTQKIDGTVDGHIING